MPPRLNIDDEAVKAAIRAANQRDQSREISKKAITFNVVTLIAVFGAIISATAVVVRKMDALERGRWTVQHEQLAWEKVADLNPGFKRPSVYLILQEIPNP